MVFDNQVCIEVMCENLILISEVSTLIQNPSNLLIIVKVTYPIYRKYRPIVFFGQALEIPSSVNLVNIFLSKRRLNFFRAEAELNYESLALLSARRYLLLGINMFLAFHFKGQSGLFPASFLNIS